MLKRDKPLFQSFPVPSSGALMMLTWILVVMFCLLFHAVGIGTSTICPMSKNTHGTKAGYVEVSNGLRPLCSSSLLVENYSKTVGNSFKLTPRTYV